MGGQERADWADAVHRVLGENGIRQVAFVPDAGLARLIALCDADQIMTSVPLTSEQEGIGLLAGAWLGGERGVLMMQSSGVGNCINALSLTRTCRFPLLILATMRGQRGEANPWQVPMGQAAPRALELAGVVVHEVWEAGEVAATVAAAAQLAFETDAAAAVLIAQRVIGVKTFDE